MTKKQMILTTAIRLFNTQGFDKTPTAQISKEAGVATGTLFHYFRNKEELINALYLHCKDSMIDAINANLEQHKSFRMLLRQIYTGFIQWGMEKPEEVLFFKQFKNSPYILEWTKKEGYDRFSGLISEMERAIAEECVKPLSTEYLAHFLMGIMMVNLEHCFHVKDLNVDAFVDESFGLIWSAIRR